MPRNSPNYQPQQTLLNPYLAIRFASSTRTKLFLVVFSAPTPRGVRASFRRSPRARKNQDWDQSLRPIKLFSSHASPKRILLRLGIQGVRFVSWRRSLEEPEFGKSTVWSSASEFLEMESLSTNGLMREAPKNLASQGRSDSGTRVGPESNARPQFAPSLVYR